ncbi:RNA polymerase sigma factor [Actinomadura xylanilytica]|uniref:RNA polymerase sigma factor n=1 Tax=Actinomadura xylanilytica TaxID=887459 RepID=UPI00255AA411|nr:sigma-70 family RNA polymerase sigma factor [Actinomadura xylanilytica]MDL4772111.1 sigma-70 family RNA polymerase sigma factor [Actinomadura xylanilytica]
MNLRPTAPAVPAAAIAARLAQDDESALADCHTALGPALRRYLRRLVPDDLVDDVVQAVLVELWRCRHRFDQARSFEAWTFTIARRRAIDQLRTRPPAALPLTQAAERPGPDTADRVAAQQDVRRALGALPALQREAIELAYFGDLTQREISARTGAPLGTVKARTARGLHRLEALLSP